MNNTLARPKQNPPRLLVSGLRLDILEQDHRQKVRAGEARGVMWKGPAAG